MEYRAAAVSPVDIFTGTLPIYVRPRTYANTPTIAEFNEDLSALHGPTLLSQKDYINRALDYILSLYAGFPNPPNQVLLLGHSMGGLVAVSLLPDERISAVITMSSPMSLPPARFDRRMEYIHTNLLQSLYPKNSSTSTAPIIALCGGATDSMIPSETCYIPPAPSGQASELYRKTVFTTSLEGVWTGVGHNEMVWCHQVRWRVARVAIEMALARSVVDRKRILDRWFLSHQAIDSTPNSQILEIPIENLATTWSTPPEMNGVRRLDVPSSALDQQLGSPAPHFHLLPISRNETHRLVVLASRASLQDGNSVFPSGSENSSLVIKLFLCSGASPETSNCSPIPLFGPQTSINALPITLAGMPFPTPKEGSDPKDVGLLFEADITPRVDGAIHAYVGVQISGLALEHQRGVAVTVEPLATSKDWSEAIPRDCTRYSLKFYGFRLTAPPLSKFNFGE